MVFGGFDLRIPGAGVKSTFLRGSKNRQNRKIGDFGQKWPKKGFACEENSLREKMWLLTFAEGSGFIVMDFWPLFLKNEEIWPKLGVWKMTMAKLGVSDR